MSGLTDVVNFQSAPVVALISFVLTKAIEAVKRSDKIPFLSQTTDSRNKWIVRGYALIMALGIEWTWSGYSPVDGGTLQLTIPPVTALVNGAWAWWTAEMNYRTFVKPKPPATAPPVIIKPEGVAA